MSIYWFGYGGREEFSPFVLLNFSSTMASHFNILVHHVRFQRELHVSNLYFNYMVDDIYYFITKWKL